MEQNVADAVTTIPSWMWGAAGFVMVTMASMLAFFLKFLHNRIWQNIDKLWAAIEDLRTEKVSKTTFRDFRSGK